MKNKRLQIVLTVLYTVMLVLNSSSIIQPVQPVSAETPGEPLSTGLAQGDPRPGICETAGRDPDGSIEAGIPQVTSNSIVFAGDDDPVTPGFTNGNANGQRLRLIPGETITFRVRVANSTNAPSRIPTILNNVSGEIVLAYSGEALPVTWDNPMFTGTLIPGQEIFGTVEYTAQIGDPQLVDYTFYGWGLREDAADPNAGQRCDQDTASASGINLMFRVEGPQVGLNLSAAAPDPLDPRIEVGAPIQWTLTITNLRNIETIISTIDDIYFETNTYGICSPPPGGTLEELLNNQEGTNILPATAGSQLEVTFTCNMLPVYPDPVVNEVSVQATVSITGFGDVTLPFETSLAVDKATPGISAVKFADATEAIVGETITYTLRVTNSGDTELNNVTVIDTLTQDVLDIPQTLLVGEVYEDIIEYIVRDIDPDPLENQVIAVGTSPQGSLVSSTGSLTLDKRNPAIELVMSVSPESAAPGTTVTYTFEVTNTGVESLANVRIEFPLCEEPGTLSGCSGDRVLLGASGAQQVSLTAGASVTGTVEYEIQGTENDPFGYSILTTATARALTNAGSTVADSATVYVDILNSAIQIQSTATPDTALRGDTIQYEFTISNNSGSPQTITSITDSLLGAIGSLPPGGLPLASGDSYVFQEYYTVGGGDLDPLVNISTVETASGLTDSTTTVVDISNAQLFITVVTDPPDEQEPGGDVDYNIFISNNGRITLNNITVDIGFAGTTESTRLDVDFLDGAGPVPTGSLAPFEQATAAFTRTVGSGDPDPLTAIVIARGWDDLGMERVFTGTATINILPTRLQLRKVANATRAGVGDIITYEFFVRNAADSAITDISVTDPLCTAAAPDPGCSGTTVLLAPYDEATGSTTGPFTEQIAELLPDAMAYGTFEYNVTNDDLALPDQLLTNTATAAGTFQDGSPAGIPVGDASQWNINVINPLVVEKFADRLYASDGQCVTYNFRVSNTGSLTTIEDITLSDNRLGNLTSTFPAFDLTPGNVLTFTDENPSCTGATQHIITSADIPRLANVVSATGTANSQILNASDNWSIDVTPPVIVTKSNVMPLFGIAVIGDVVRYRVTITNVSDSPYEFRSARDISNSFYTSGPTAIPISTLIANSSDPVNPLLEPGELTWYEYTYEVGPRDPDQLVNTFEVVMRSEGTDVTFSDTHTIEVYSPFGILKIPDRFFAIVGQTIHYDYLIYNISQLTMTNVVVVDDRLGPIATQRFNPGGVPDPGNGYVTIPHELPPAEEYPCVLLFCDAWYLESSPAENNYTVRPTDLVSETLVNVVTVSGNTTIGSVEPNVPIITTERAEVQIANPLRVTAVGPLTASRGDTITYSITLTNISPIDSGNTISNINVIDTFSGLITMEYLPPLVPRTLEPGQSVTRLISIPIQQNASDPLRNTVNATGELQIGGETYNLTSIGTFSIDLDDPILEVILNTSSEAHRGETVTWYALLQNNGDSDLENLTYTDLTGVDIGAHCPSELPAYSPPVECSWEYTFTLSDPDPYDNLLTVTATTLGGDSFTGGDNFVVDLINPEFRVSKGADRLVAAVDDTIVYRIEVANTSDAMITNVSAYDILTGPVPLEFPSGLNGVLNAGETAWADITYTLSQSDPNPLVNEVTANGISDTGITLEDTTYTSVTISSLRLLVNKQASAPVVQLGDTITYNISITNIGQGPIRNIQIVDEAVGLDTASDPNHCGGTITYDGQTYDLNCTVDTPLTINPIDALNPFEVAFMTYSVEATPGLPDPFINAALVSGADDTGESVEGSDSIAVDILTPGIRLTKTANMAGAAIDDEVLYTVNLTNTTGGQLTNVQVYDNEAEQFIEMSLGGAPLTYTIDVMEDGQTAVGVIRYTVTPETPNPFINTVTVTNDQGLTDGAAATIEIRDLGIRVTKIPRSPSAVVGDVVTYDIEVQNTSSQNLRAVIAIDRLTDTTVPLFDPTTGDQVNELAAGASAIGTFEYTIPPDVPDPLVNRVSASARADSGVFVSSSGLALVDIREADISLTKTASTAVALVGDTVTYDFVVRNEGNATLNNIVLTDPLCATAATGCSSGTEVSLTFPGTPGTLESEQEATGSITREILPGDPDPLINRARVFAETLTGITIYDDATAEVALATSDLVITKSILGVVAPEDTSCAAPELRTAAQIGDIIAYEITLSNIGLNYIDNILVVDTLNGTDITDQLFPLPPARLDALGSVSTCIRIPVTNTSHDPLVNIVEASGLLNGATLITDRASAEIPLASSDLLVTNVPSQTSARIGNTITYTVTIRNNGLEILDNVQATSPQAGGSIALNTTSLVPGQSAIGTYTHTITGLDADPFLSTVTATAVAPGPITLTDTATARVDLASDGIRLIKEAAPTLASAGSDIVYTLTITNTGTENITSFSVVDQMMGGDITGCFNPDIPLPASPPACIVPASTPLPLLPGASVSTSIRRTLSGSDGDPATNYAVVTAEAYNPANPAEPIILSDNASASVHIAGSGLTVIKTADVAAALDGDTVNYTLEIINTSTTRVTGLTVADTLVSGLTLPRYSLNPNERITTTYSHTINAATDTNPVVNQVQVSGVDGVGISVSDTSLARVAILDSDTIRVTVVPDRTTVLANQTINYLATITNISADTLNDISAVATLHDGSTIDLTSLLSTTTLTPGSSTSATFSYTVRAVDSSPVIATVRATSGTISATGSSSVVIRISSIRISAAPSNCGFPCIGVIGDTIRFTATIQNDGATTLTNVSLFSDTLVSFEDNPAGLILAPGQTYTATFTYTVPLNTPNPAYINLRAQGVDPIGTTVTSRSYSYRLTTANPRISVTLSPDRVSALDGQVVNYTAEIRNVGTEPLQNLALVDSLAGVQTNSITVSVLNPGQATSVTYSYMPVSGAFDPMVNTVTVSGQTSFGRSVTDNDTTVVNILRPQLYISLTADRQVAMLGENINYTVSILNTGDGPINNLRGSYLVDSSLSASMMMHPAEQGGSIMLGSTSLPQGVATTGFFSYIPTTGDPNPLGMRAIVSGDGVIGDTLIAVSDSATALTSLVYYDAQGNPLNIAPPIIGTADPEVVKLALDPFVEPGGLITWTMTVRNPGTDTLAGVVITDRLDIKMRVESVAITNGTIESESNTIVAITEPLDFNETANLTIVARLNEGVIAGALIQNLGCATSVGATASVCDVAVVRVAPDAQMLPATGQAATDGSSTPAVNPALALTILLALGLLGLSVQNPQPGSNRMLVFAILLVAAVIIVAVIVGLITTLGPTSGTEAAETPGETAQAVVEGPTPTAAQPTAAPVEGQPTPIPPTPIPIPTAAGPLPPTEVPSGPPPFMPQYERELFIPRLNLSAALPIINVPLRNRTWDVRDLGGRIGFLQGTSWVDEAAGEHGGNTVLAGHVQITEEVPGPFRDLDLLEAGDSIFLADNSAIHEFEVYEIAVVAADDVGVTYPTDEQMLTLITCTTWNAFRGVFAERLIVRARPLRSITYTPEA